MLYSAAKALGIVALSALLAAPFSSLAQAARTLKLGILDEASEETRSHYWQLFRKRLRELGYTDGKNLVIEARRAHGATERLPALAAELVAARPDIIVVTSTLGTRAAIKATSSIPIVFTGLADPVASGLVTSLARPGGNATGLSIITEELGVKWVELLREIAPQAKRVVYFGDTASPGSVLVFNRIRDHGRSLGMTIEMFDGKPNSVERSFDAIARERFDGLIVASTATIFDSRAQIVQFAARQKLPAIYARREYADIGGLLSYGADLDDQWKRTAEYVHRLAQGAKPADTPVERPSSVRMVLNLKTSRVLGISVPPSIRHRADELIE